LAQMFEGERVASFWTIHPDRDDIALALDEDVLERMRRRPDIRGNSHVPRIARPRWEHRLESLRWEGHSGRCASRGPPDQWCPSGSLSPPPGSPPTSPAGAAPLQRTRARTDART